MASQRFPRSGCVTLSLLLALGSSVLIAPSPLAERRALASGGITIPPPAPSSTGWQILGNTVYDPSGNLQLTTDGQSGAGAAYWSTAISPTSVTATFDETISGRDPADGLAFDLLNADSSSAPSLGGGGADLGFGPNPGRAVAFVENARPWGCYPSDHFIGSPTVSK
jgi:hypothetical protein